MKCSSCGGSAFVQATDYINLRPIGKRSAFGSEKVYTVCVECGEVISIKIANPERLKQ